MSETSESKRMEYLELLESRINNFKKEEHKYSELVEDLKQFHELVEEGGNLKNIDIERAIKLYKDAIKTSNMILHKYQDKITVRPPWWSWKGQEILNWWILYITCWIAMIASLIGLIITSVIEERMVLLVLICILLPIIILGSYFWHKYYKELKLREEKLREKN